MIGRRIAVDSVDRYRPCGAFGNPAYQSHLQMRAALMAKRGPRFANCFAKPNLDARDRSLSWTSEVGGDPVAWASMPPAEQAQRVAEMEALRGGFESYINELRQHPDSGKGAGGGQALASLLEQALKVPDAGHLHFVGDQPVFSFWGFEGHNGESVNPLALRPGAAPPVVPPAPVADDPPAAFVQAVAPPVAAPEPLPPPPPAPVPPAPVVRRRGWWWWLLALLLLLLALLALYYVPSCGLRIPGIWPGDEGPGAGPQTAPSPADDKPETLALPDDAERSGRLDFLEGTWRAYGIVDRGTGKPVDLSFSFGKDGRGEVRVRKSTDGTLCSGPVAGKIEGGKLTVESQGPIRCATGDAYQPQRFECSDDASRRTTCRGVNRDGSTYAMDVARLK